MILFLFSFPGGDCDKRISMSNPESVWSFCGQDPNASYVFPCKEVVLFLYDQLNRVCTPFLQHKRGFLSIRVAAGEGGRLWP